MILNEKINRKYPGPIILAEGMGIYVMNNLPS